MNHLRNNRKSVFWALFAIHALDLNLCLAEEVGHRWGTEERERKYYPIVNVPLPKDTVVEAGAFTVLPDNRVAVGTRHGEIYLIDGIDEKKPNPGFQLFADTESSEQYLWSAAWFAMLLLFLCTT